MNVAVILTGAPRTWNFCKEYILKFVNDIYGSNVDWYVSFYESLTTNKQEVENYFLNNQQNLISLKFFKKEKIFNYENSWNDLKWTNSIFKGLFQLNYLTGLEKRLHEFKTGKKYDIVFFARPDCIYFYDETTKIRESNRKIKDFAFQAAGDFNDGSYPFINPSANHLHIVAGMFSSDLYLNWNLDYNFQSFNFKKFGFRLGKDMHSALSDFFRNHLITTEPNNYVKYSFFAQVIRPTHIFYNKKYYNFALEYYNKMHTPPREFEPGYCEYFKHEDIEQRFNYVINSCYELGIDPEDYEFNDKQYIERKINEYLNNKSR